MNASRHTRAGQTTSRDFALGKAVPLLLLLLVPLCFCRPCRAAIRTEPLILNGLNGNSVTIHTRMRFDVKKIELQGDNVLHFFKVKRAEQPTWWKPFAETTIDISVDAERADELQAALDKAPLKELKVTLLDEWAVLRWVPWSDNEEFHRREYTIPVETTCEEITNIFYKRINALFEQELQREAAGSTTEPVNLNYVFGKLVEGQLEYYLDTLRPVRRDAKCQTTFELLNWLKGGEASGFVSGKYHLRDDLKGLLETMARAVEAVKADWSQYDLNIKIIGYTDLDKIKSPLSLSANQTGVYWGNLKDPPEVYYGGCSDDKLVPGDGPVYRDFEAGGGEPVGTIKNNCELGAARAYVATVYLFNRLGASNLTYSYATGGVHPKSDSRNRASYAEQRKIDIMFTLNAARTIR